MKFSKKFIKGLFGLLVVAFVAVTPFEALAETVKTPAKIPVQTTKQVAKNATMPAVPPVKAKK